jgi:hypothetical protein
LLETLVPGIVSPYVNFPIQARYKFYTSVADFANMENPTGAALLSQK